MHFQLFSLFQIPTYDNDAFGKFLLHFVKFGWD